MNTRDIFQIYNISDEMNPKMENFSQEVETEKDFLTLHFLISQFVVD